MDAVGVGERVDVVRVRLPQGEVELDPLSAAVLRGLVENREDVAVVPFDLLVASTAPQTKKHPARMILSVPEAVVQEWQKGPGERSLMALVHIPRTVLEEWDRLIVTPAKAAAQRGGLIVAP